MQIKETVCGLIDAYTQLAEFNACSERGTMETLLGILKPEELICLGYGERVKAYFDEYGAGDELDGLDLEDEL